MKTLPGGKLPTAVEADFDGEFGDRRQEIVLIGVGMDRPAIEAALDACLLTDAEVLKYRQHFGGSSAVSETSIIFTMHE